MLTVADNSDGNTNANDADSKDRRARVGDLVTITGTQFGSSEPVSIVLGTQPFQATTSTDGVFMAQFVIAEQTEGDKQLTATGQVSNSSVTLSFTILPPVR